MATIRQLKFATSVNTNGFDEAVSTLSSKASAVSKGIGDKLGNITPAYKTNQEGGNAAGANPGNQAEQLGAAVLPMASKVQSSIAGAMAPLSSFASRFGAEFEQVGSTIIAISKKIDNALRFPAFQKGMDAIRAKAADTFKGAEGNARHFATAVDRSLGAIQAGSKIKGFVGSFGGLDNKLRALKAPNLDFSPASRSILSVQKATEVARGSMKAFGTEVALALGAFGLVFKAVGFIKTGIGSAMALGETVSKVATVFGDETGKITAQTDEMATRFGLVKGPLLDSASSFGLMGKAAGLTGPKVSELANGMTKLAADAMSFYNIPFEEAQQKLRAGLAGEAEPLRALGVFLSDATVQQEAFRLGLIKTKDDLTESIKIQSRASLISKGLGDATGDLERTQGSAANQVRKFTGSLTNIGSSIGEVLLPALTKGIGLLNEFGSYALGVFEANKETLRGWGDALTTVFETVGGLFRNWQEVFEISRLSIVQGLLNLGEHFDVLGPNVALVAKYIGDNWYQLIVDSFTATLAVAKNFGKNITALGTSIGEFFQNPTQNFKVEWSGLLDGFEATAAKLPEMIKPHLTDMSREIDAAAGRIRANEAKRAETTKAITTQSAKRGVVDPNAKEGPTAKEMEKLTKFSETFKEKTQTAFEKYGEAMGQARKAFEAGLITKEQFGRSEMFAKKEADLDGERKFAGATELGSKEAYSSIVQATSGRSDGLSNLERTNQQQLGVLNTIAAGIGSLAKAATATPPKPMGLMN